MSGKSSLLSLIEAKMNISSPPTQRREGDVLARGINVVPPELEDDVKRILESPPRYEVEVSFGTFKEGGEHHFIPGAISVWQFSVLSKTLRNLVERGVATLKDEKTDVEVMQNLQRGDKRMFYRRIKKLDGTVVWENKRRDRGMIENPYWGYRISRSEEEITSNPPFDVATFAPNFIRHRRRLTFYINPGSDMSGFQFDLTHIVEEVIKGPQSYSKIKYEIEIERTRSTLDSDTLLTHLTNTIEFTVKAMQGQQDYAAVDEHQLMSLPERLQVSRIHGKYYQSKHENPYKLYKDYWNKPVNAERKGLLNPKLNQYSVTLKLDGVRRFIMLSNEVQHIYSLSPPDDSWTIGSRSNLKFTLLDTEYYDNDYYAFDILYYDGIDVGGKTFKERLLLLNKVVEGMPDLYGGAKITVKHFYTPPTAFYENVRAAFDKMEATSKVRYDGLILQPPGPYKNNETLKWKPESQMTIDFYVSKRGLTGVDEYGLWVGINKDVIRFEGTRRYPYTKNVIIPGGKFDDMNVEGAIIEFSWDVEAKNFVPHKLREDRDRPNAKSTAEDVWRDIMEPISRATMEGDTLDIMRIYHNDVKRRMLETELSHGDAILDIGSGKGGDLGKWRDIQLSKVFVVEPNEENLEELEKRAKEMGLEDLYQIVQAEGGALAGAEDAEDIETTIDNTKIAAIVAFFSLTFFGKDQDTFKQLIDSIDKNLPKDGKLIGIVMDGVRVKEDLSRTPAEADYAASIITPAYSIEQASKFSVSGEYEAGRNEIEIDIKGAATVHKQTEWLFYYDKLKSALARKGIREEKTSFLDKGPSFDVLPKDSQRFSALYRTFVFARTERPKVERSKVVGPDDMIPFPQAQDIYHEDLYTVLVDRDRSSFIRAVVRAFDREYLGMEPKERTAYINKVRGMLSRKAKDLGLYSSLNGGEIEQTYTDSELYDMGITSPDMKPSTQQQTEAEEIGQLMYRRKLADPDEYLSHKDVRDVMSKVLGINILVLRGNGEPVHPSYLPVAEYRKSVLESNGRIVIVVYDGTYYSLLAKKMDDDIYTLFESNNSLVRKILE